MSALVSQEVRVLVCEEVRAVVSVLEIEEETEEVRAVVSKDVRVVVDRCVSEQGNESKWQGAFIRCFINAKNIWITSWVFYRPVCFQFFRNAELLVLQVDKRNALFCYCTLTKQKKSENEPKHL